MPNVHLLSKDKSEVMQLNRHIHNSGAAAVDGHYCRQNPGQTPRFVLVGYGALASPTPTRNLAAFHSTDTKDTEGVSARLYIKSTRRIKERKGVNDLADEAAGPSSFAALLGFSEPPDS
jgi:hypothetical protein